MTNRTAQARAEAERQYRRIGGMPRDALCDFKRLSFVSGVEWADANPKPHAITRKQAIHVWLSGEDFSDFADALRAAGIEVADDE